MKILMVCLGNICRSPMADGLLRFKVTQNNLNVTVDSAGTASYHVGEQPDQRMTETAKKHGIDLTVLRARQFKTEDFDEFDMIYAMDTSNRSNMLRLARNEDDVSKVKLILDEIYPGENMEVPDPYYGGQKGFEHVYDLLDRATDQIIEQLK